MCKYFQCILTNIETIIEIWIISTTHRKFHLVLCNQSSCITAYRQPFIYFMITLNDLYCIDFPCKQIHIESFMSVIFCSALLFWDWVMLQRTWTSIHSFLLLNSIHYRNMLAAVSFNPFTCWLGLPRCP